MVPERARDYPVTADATRFVMVKVSESDLGGIHVVTHWFTELERLAGR